MPPSGARAVNPQPSCLSCLPLAGRKAAAQASEVPLSESQDPCLAPIGGVGSGSLNLTKDAAASPHGAAPGELRGSGPQLKKAAVPSGLASSGEEGAIAAVHSTTRGPQEDEPMASVDAPPQPGGAPLQHRQHLGDDFRREGHKWVALTKEQVRCSSPWVQGHRALPHAHARAVRIAAC